MRERGFGGWWSVSITMLVAALTARDDALAQTQRTWHLGALQWHDSPNDLAALDGLQTALREAGITHAIELRQANSDRDLARAALREFEARGVDLIVALGTEAALIAAEQEHAIPIVFTAVTNPVASGVVPSWQGSGRNLAGNSNWIAPEISLRVFTLAVPGLTRLGILRSTSTGKVSTAELEAMRQKLAEPSAPKIELIEAQVTAASEIAQATEQLVASGAQAVWVPIDFLIYENLPAILSVTEAKSVPIVATALRAVNGGAVAGVVRDYRLLGAQAAAIALEILAQRRDPGTIAIGTMHSYEIVVNMGAARRARYQLPLSLLAMADQILEPPPALETSDGR